MLYATFLRELGAVSGGSALPGEMHGHGFVRVSWIPDEIPWFGNFVLIEIGIQQCKAGRRLSHVAGHVLERHFALLSLIRSDHAILDKIMGPATLNEQQKEHIRDFVKSRFLRPVWHSIDTLLS